jgi:hypothetical protein
MACTGIGALAAARIRLFGGVNPERQRRAELDAVGAAGNGRRQAADAVDADFEDARAHDARPAARSAAPMKAGLSLH